MSASAFLIAVTAASAEEMAQIQPHHTDPVSHDGACKAATQDAAFSEGFESVQIETSDITRYEYFFEAVLHASAVQRMDHPQADRIRGYCYRGALIVVRQDLRSPRPTGWVQINFTVSDVVSVQEEVERSYRAAALFPADEEERNKIVRFQLKPDVTRGDRKAARFEVTGPEGFMIGFNQYK